MIRVLSTGSSVLDKRHDPAHPGSPPQVPPTTHARVHGAGPVPMLSPTMISNINSVVSCITRLFLVRHGIVRSKVLRSAKTAKIKSGRWPVFCHETPLLFRPASTARNVELLPKGEGIGRRAEIQPRSNEDSDPRVGLGLDADERSPAFVRSRRAMAIHRKRLH